MSVTTRETELMALNKSLLMEVDNYRDFMRRTGSSMRVSKRVVRAVEVDPAKSLQVTTST